MLFCALSHYNPSEFSSNSIHVCCTCNLRYGCTRESLMKLNCCSAMITCICDLFSTTTCLSGYDNLGLKTMTCRSGYDNLGLGTMTCLSGYDNLGLDQQHGQADSLCSNFILSSTYPSICLYLNLLDSASIFAWFSKFSIRGICNVMRRIIFCTDSAQSQFP